MKLPEDGVPSGQLSLCGCRGWCTCGAVKVCVAAGDGVPAGQLRLRARL